MKRKERKFSCDSENERNGKLTKEREERFRRRRETRRRRGGDTKRGSTLPHDVVKYLKRIIVISIIKETKFFFYLCEEQFT